MADNSQVTAGSGTYIASHEAPFSGDTAKIQVIHPAFVSGSEGSKTVNEIHGNGAPAVDAYGLTVRRPVVTTHHRIAAGTSGDVVSVKASAGTLKSVHIFNADSVPCYVKFHNTAGTPTAGASVVLTVGCQAGLARDFVLPSGGRAFTTGIGMSIVTGITDASSTSVTASTVSVEVSYE